MACEDIKTKQQQTRQQLDALYQQKESAYASAKLAYQSYQFHKVGDQKFADNFVGFFDGKEFRDPYALEAYAKQQFDKKDAIFQKLRDEFNALVDVQDQLNKDLAACEAQEAAKKTNNAGTGTPGTAGTGPGATPAPAPSPTTLPNANPTTNATTTTPEVGKDKPAPIEPTPKTAQSNPADALTEVTVTGKKAPTNTNSGIPGTIRKTQSQATLQDTTNFEQKKDWRFRLSLSPGATYLYKDKTNKLLEPLAQTDGIIFPYTPSVNVTYGANYDTLAPIHSNYKIFNYQNSYVDNISITCDFTAQDTYEANYVLAVIHFLRSATKMFYGQDENPKPGTPPPLCYLFGFGQYQFNAHPVLINNFTYNLPQEVDYIRAGQTTTMPGESKADTQPKKEKSLGLGQQLQNFIQSRLEQGVASVGKAVGLSLTPGGSLGQPTFGGQGFNSTVPPTTTEPTYVPTKIQIAISCYPVISRYQISNKFSLKEYANGNLLLGTKRPGGGIW